MSDGSRMLPEEVRETLWEYRPDDVTWEGNREFIVERVLSRGTWDAVRWVRSQVGDSGLGDVIVRSRGRMLTPAQLRFWQLILGLPENVVTGWLESEDRIIWDRKAG